MKTEEGSNVIFSANKANQGGAIHSNSGNVILAGNTLFTGNMGSDGGAILTSRSTLTLLSGSTTTFIGNTAIGRGGAILNGAWSGASTFDAQSGSVLIFSSNTAGNSGGAVYNETYNNIGAGAIFKADSAIFTFNKATNGGGAIYNNAAMSIGHASFYGNQSETDGGAIYNTGSPALLSLGEASFTSNTAAGNGGAVWGDTSSYISFNGGITTFTGNTAGQNGGGLYLAQSSVTFDGAVNFTSNTATAGAGGAIYSGLTPGQTYTFNGATAFMGNSAKSGGGAIYNNANMSFSGSEVTFDGNTAGAGGAIYNGISGIINFETETGSGITFRNNKAAAGNDIYNLGTINISGTGDVIFGGGIEGIGTINKSGSGTIYFESGSRNYFGTLNLSEGNAYFAESSKISNMNAGAAGTLTLDVDFLGSLTSVLYFDNVTINTSGSKLYINNISAGSVGNGANVAIFYSNTQNNGTFGDGNIYDMGSGSTTSYTLVWQSGSFDNGYSWMGLLTYYNIGPWNTFVAAYKAVTSGNTINLANSITATDGDENPFGMPGYNNITINGLGNTIDAAGKAGLGFVLNGSSITFRDINFNNFVLAGQGGAIALTNSRAIFEGEAAFTNNSNGAIYNGNNSEITFNNSNVEFTNIINGAGIKSDYNSIATFNGGSAAFVGNIITIPGGGAAVTNYHNSTTTFSNMNVSFSSNVSTAYGGAILNDFYSTLIFSSANVSFTGNRVAGSAWEYGGAIYNSGSIIRFNDSEVAFTSNSAGDLGGAILGNSEITFNNSKVEFTGNTARNNGGAIYSNAPNMSFSGCDVTFYGNTAVNGGAIYNSISGIISFETEMGIGITFRNNEATAGKDIYNLGIINISGAGDVILGGGIEGSGIINKTGSGSMYFEKGSVNNFGSLNLTEGNVQFSESSKISNMNAGAAGTLTLDVDFFGSLTSVLSFDNITIDSANSKLYINNISSGTTANGANVAIFYSNTQNNGTFGDNNICDTASGSTTSYTLVWQSGSFDNGYSWMGLLTYYNIGPWNRFVAGYKTVTSGNTINLANSITATDDDDNPFGLPGYDNITINGLGNTIDAAGRTGKGFAFSGLSVTFKDVNFVNFNGVAIKNDYNSATTFDGGAVAFTNNRITILGGGAAIMNYHNSTMTFSNTDVSFSSNVSTAYGGAILNDFGSTLIFSSANVSFTGNSVTGNTYAYGGAIYNSGSVIAFNGGEVSFTSNSAGDLGGAILGNSEITFNNSKVEFTGNTAGNNGGAIYNNAPNMSFSGSEVTFNGNTAVNNGGAIFNNNSLIDFASSLVSFINNSANFGGAAYSAGGSNMNFSGGEVVFEGNEAGNSGGALYITAGAVNFNTDGGEVLFTGNKAAGNPNDVYMDINARLNVSGSNSIRFEDGILSNTSGFGIEINKSGDGAIYLGGRNEVWGDFNISGGDIIMMADASYRGKALKLGNTSALDMHNGTADTVEVNGNFESLKNLKMDIFNDGTSDKIKAGSANIGGNIDVFAGVGSYNQQEFDLITTSNNLTGVFVSSSISSGNLTYDLKYEDGTAKLIVDGTNTANLEKVQSLPYNQSQIAGALDKISANPGKWSGILTQMKAKQESGNAEDLAEVKNFLKETASGDFLANVVRNLAADSPNNEIYDKIRNHKDGRGTNSGLWVQLKSGIESFKGDENSPDDYNDVSMGVMFGFDRFLSEKFAGGDIIWGVYGRINKDNIEQGKFSADGNKNGLGIYGGYLKDRWELKGMLLGSYDKFSTERDVSVYVAKADINAVTVSADLEAAINMALTENMLLKPYAGLEAANSAYEGFKERGADIYNLDVEGSSYLRTGARVGAGIDYEKDIWTWYANAELKYIFEGIKSEIENKFENTGVNFNSIGAEEGKVQIGLGLGGEVRIARNWKTFANVKYYTAERYENLYGNIGVRYMFGK